MLFVGGGDDNGTYIIFSFLFACTHINCIQKRYRTWVSMILHFMCTFVDIFIIAAVHRCLQFSRQSDRNIRLTEHRKNNATVHVIIIGKHHKNSTNSTLLCSLLLLLRSTFLRALLKMPIYCRKTKITLRIVINPCKP